MFEYGRCPLCEADMFTEMARGVFECGNCFAIFNDEDESEEEDENDS